MATILNVYYLQVLIMVCTDALLGLSVYLVFSTGQLTLGNAGFMAIGAYTAALFALKSSMPIWLTLLLGAVLAAVVAIPLGYASLRLSGIYLAVATLGFSESIKAIAQNLDITGGALGLNNIPNIPAMVQKALSNGGGDAPFGLQFNQIANAFTLLLLMVILALAIWFVVRQGNSRVGRAYTAIRTDEVAAGAMGINTTYYKVLAFVQGAFMAGLAGGLSAHITYTVSPANFDFNTAVAMLTFVVVGGSEHPWGGIVGAVVMDVLSELLRDVTIFGINLSDDRFILFGLIMMVMMALRPQGILGHRGVGRKAKAKPDDKAKGVAA